MNVSVHRVPYRFLFWAQQSDAKQVHYIELRKNKGTGVLILSGACNVSVDRGNSGELENDRMIGSLAKDSEDAVSCDDDMLGCLLL